MALLPPMSLLMEAFRSFVNNSSDFVAGLYIILAHTIDSSVVITFFLRELSDFQTVSAFLCHRYSLRDRLSCFV